MAPRRALTGPFSTGYQPLALSRLPLPCRSSYDCEAASWYKAVEGRFEAKRIARAHLCASSTPNRKHRFHSAAPVGDDLHVVLVPTTGPLAPASE